MPRKQFLGTIVTITNTAIVMRMLPKNGIVALDAGARVLAQARLMGPGRTARFSAELDERTECLSSPRFVVASEFGLQAVDVTAEVGR